VDLVLFCADEGALVDVGVDFDVGVVGELEGVPLAVVDWHGCCLVGYMREVDLVVDRQGGQGGMFAVVCLDFL
jgi:hypothetical protein